MSTRRYGFKYAEIRTTDGLCIGMQDTTDLYLDPRYVPIEDDTLPYLLKYYHPVPDTVTSFDDFQGKWYSDSAYTIEVPELNG